MQVSFDNGVTFYDGDIPTYTLNLTLDGTNLPTYYTTGGVYSPQLYVGNVWGYMRTVTLPNVSVCCN